MGAWELLAAGLRVVTLGGFGGSLVCGGGAGAALQLLHLFLEEPRCVLVADFGRIGVKFGLPQTRQGRRCSCCICQGAMVGMAVGCKQAAGRAKVCCDCG